MQTGSAILWYEQNVCDVTEPSAGPVRARFVAGVTVLSAPLALTHV